MYLLHYFIAVLRKVFSSQKSFRVCVKQMYLFMHLGEKIELDNSRITCHLFFGLWNNLKGSYFAKKDGDFQNSRHWWIFSNDSIRIYFLSHALSLMEGNAWDICGFFGQLDLPYSTILFYQYFGVLLLAVCYLSFCLLPEFSLSLFLSLTLFPLLGVNS